jgi:Fic family protein
VQISTTGEVCKAFVPTPLPPVVMPSIVGFQGLYEEANRALGRLDGLSMMLPEPSLFLYMYIRKEAVLSSQIEGTQSSLSELLLFEDANLPGVPLDDVQEVSNYVAALNHGLRRMREDGFPLCLRLLLEVHSALLAKGRGSDKAPGEFRRSQNWIGGTRPGNARYVPPPADLVMECMGSLEKFLHDDPAPTPTLIKAALAHVQFETIHPFLDGNGRLGRLLITLLLCAENALREPLLYLSLYFKTHRAKYYDLLQRVRTEGGWESWICFFLTGIKETGDQAAMTATRVLQLFDADRKRIQAIGKPAGSALRVHHHLERKPLTTVQAAARALHLAEPTVRSSFAHLSKLGIAKEVSGRQRGQVFGYQAYIHILSEGTEPLGSARTATGAHP